MTPPELLANSPVPGIVVPLAALTSTINNSTLSFPMDGAAPASLRGTGQFRAVIDSEIILFDASQVSTTTWTALARGVEGTTAATHVSSALAFHYLTAGGLAAFIYSSPQKWTATQTMTEIDFWDGTDPAQVKLIADKNNWGLNAVGVYPIGGALAANVNIFDHNVNPNGTVATPAALATYLGPANVYLVDAQTFTGGLHLLANGGPDSVANSYYGLIGFSRDSAAPAAGTIPAWQLEDAGASTVPMAAFYDGSLRWGAASNTGGDTTLIRAAAGVLQIPQVGGGLKLTSPDGSQTKQIQLSNAGALVLV